MVVLAQVREEEEEGGQQQNKKKKKGLTLLQICHHRRRHHLRWHPALDSTCTQAKHHAETPPSFPTARMRMRSVLLGKHLRVVHNSSNLDMCTGTDTGTGTGASTDKRYY